MWAGIDDGTSKLIPAALKIVPDFIANLDCKGLVGKVYDTFTHIIVSTGEELEVQRTKAYKWEVIDEELMGSNGPWRARKRREEGQEPLLAGFQILIEYPKYHIQPLSKEG